MKQQPQALGPDQVHGDAADEVGKVIRPNFVGDDHHREERDQRREQQAVDENHQPGLLQVLQLGMFDLAIDLCQSLFAGHGQHGVPEADEHDESGENAERQVPEPGCIQPAQRFFIQRHHARVQRVGRQLHWSAQNRDGAPDDQDHDHYRGDRHDLQGFLAGLVHALGILPPEIKHDDHGQARGEMVVGKMERAVHVHAHVFDEARQVLPRGNGADGAGQHVIEKQRRDGKLGQAYHPWLP